MKTRIILGIVIVLIVLNVGIINADDKYAEMEIIKETCLPSTKDIEYKNGIHKLTIGNQYYVDHNCTKIEDSPSIKNSEFNYAFPIRIRQDLNYPLNQKDVYDYYYINKTHLEIKFYATVQPGMLKIDIPIKVYDRNEIITEETKFNIKYYGEKELITVRFKQDDKIHIGEHSTILELQDANTENLDDTAIQTSNDNDYGDSVECWFNSVYSTFYSENQLEACFFKFDISSIPASQTILSSTLTLHSNANGIDAGEGYDIYVHHVYESPAFQINGGEWTEGDGSDPASGQEAYWDVMPSSSSQWNSTGEDSIYFSQATGTGYHVWTTTNMVSKAYVDGDNQLSIYVKGILGDFDGSPTSTDDVDIDTKEASTAEYRPKLTITYESGGGGGYVCNSTYSGTGNYELNCSCNPIIPDNYDINGNELHITENGTITITGSIIGYSKKTVREDGCVIVTG